MIIVIATVQVQSGQRVEFLSLFHQVVPKVQAEDGCIEYGPTVDVPTNIAAQPEVRADTVTIVEKWRDLDALEAHLIAPHMLEYRQQVKQLVQSASLQVLEPV